MKMLPIVQGSDEWINARCGLLTASEMKLIVTPGLKPASNDKERTHLYELLAQRLTNYVEPSFISDDMVRGYDDEASARALYEQQYAPVDTLIGFITNDKWGFTLGYSPDGLVGGDGLIECKSRRQKYQVQAIVEEMSRGFIPTEHMLQVQTGLLVSERCWCDYISYSAGLPMMTVRVFPHEQMQSAILAAAAAFEERLEEKLRQYEVAIAANDARAIPTERAEREIVL